MFTRRSALSQRVLHAQMRGPGIADGKSASKSQTYRKTKGGEAIQRPRHSTRQACAVARRGVIPSSARGSVRCALSHVSFSYP
jgi:hypothetical protein